MTIRYDNQYWPDIVIIIHRNDIGIQWRVAILVVWWCYLLCYWYSVVFPLFVCWCYSHLTRYDILDVLSVLLFDVDIDDTGLLFHFGIVDRYCWCYWCYVIQWWYCTVFILDDYWLILLSVFWLKCCWYWWWPIPIHCCQCYSDDYYCVVFIDVVHCRWPIRSIDTLFIVPVRYSFDVDIPIVGVDIRWLWWYCYLHWPVLSILFGILSIIVVYYSLLWLS